MKEIKQPKVKNAKEHPIKTKETLINYTKEKTHKENLINQQTTKGNIIKEPTEIKKPETYADKVKNTKPENKNIINKPSETGKLEFNPAEVKNIENKQIKPEPIINKSTKKSEENIDMWRIKTTGTPSQNQ